MKMDRDMLVQIEEGLSVITVKKTRSNLNQEKITLDNSGGQRV